MILDLYYIENSTIAHYLMYYHIYCIVFCFSKCIFWYWFLHHIFKKIGTVKHSLLCYVGIFFPTPKLVWRLKTQNTEVFHELLLHSYRQVLRCATVHSLHGGIFHFSNGPHIVYMEQLRAEGQPLLHLYPLLLQLYLRNVCRLWFCIVLLKCCTGLTGKMPSLNQHLFEPFSINWAITEVQVTSGKGTATIAYNDGLDGPISSLFHSTKHPFLPKKDLECWFVWPQYTFLLCDGLSWHHFWPQWK